MQSLPESGIISVVVKPNSKKTGLLGFDETKKSFIVAVNEPADKDKANIELIRFFSKLLKKKVRIKSGLRSKNKILEIIS